MGGISVKYELQGVPIGTPKNAREISIETNWRGDKQENTISLNTFVFALEQARAINNHVANGMNGGVGIFEGIPFKIRLTQNSINEVIADGFIDLTNNANFIGCQEVEAEYLEKQGVDWLNDVADSFSFAYLASNDGGNLITNNDYVDVPYVIGFRPEGFAVATLSLAIFMTAKELAQAVKDTVDAIADLVEVAGKTFGAIGEILSAAIRAVALVAYTVAITIALIKLMRDLIEQLYPPTAIHRGIKVKTLFQKGCEYLGLNFESTIFDLPIWKDLTILPQKTQEGTRTGNGVGHPNANSNVYTFGDLIRWAKEYFYADFKINNGTLRFEHDSYWDSQSSFVMPSVYVNQSRKTNEIKYNTQEIISNYLVSYSTDVQDKNTLENFLGTNYQAITTPINVNNQEAVMIKNLAQIRFPFARGVRKEGLNRIETILKDLAKAVDNVINFFGGNSSLSASIQNRVGMLELSSHQTSVDKLLVVDSNGKLPNSLDSDCTAKNVYETFHYPQSFIDTVSPLTGERTNGQALIFESVKTPFCPQDYLNLKENNKFTTDDGREGEMLLQSWSIYEGTATVDFKIKQKYTNNLKIQFNEGE